MALSELTQSEGYHGSELNQDSIDQLNDPVGSIHHKSERDELPNAVGSQQLNIDLAPH